MREGVVKQSKRTNALLILRRNSHTKAAWSGDEMVVVFLVLRGFRFFDLVRFPAPSVRIPYVEQERLTSSIGTRLEIEPPDRSRCLRIKHLCPNKDSENVLDLSFFKSAQSETAQLLVMVSVCKNGDAHFTLPFSKNYELDDSTPLYVERQ